MRKFKLRVGPFQEVRRSAILGMAIVKLTLITCLPILGIGR